MKSEHLVFLLEDDNDKIREIEKEADQRYIFGPFYANLNLYLHVDTSSDSEDIQDQTQPGESVKWQLKDIGTLTTMMEPHLDTDEAATRFFFMNTENLFIDLDDPSISSVLIPERVENENFSTKLEKKSKNYVVRGFVSDPNGERKESKQRRFLKLYDFLVGVSWWKVAKPLRKRIADRPEILDADSKDEWIREYLDDTRFAKKLHELRAYLSFEGKAIRLIGSTSAEDLDKAPRDFQVFVSGLLTGEGEEDPKTAMKEIRLNKLVKETTLTRGGEYLFENRCVGFSNVSDWEMPKYRANQRDYQESGTRWFISWFMLLGDMLCSLSDTFSLHSNRLERYTTQKRSARKLAEIARSTVRDFERYYDVDITVTGFFQSLFETAKKSFGIKRYYRILKDQLRILEYEAFEELSWVSTVGNILSIAAVLLAILALLASLHIWPFN